MTIRDGASACRCCVSRRGVLGAALALAAVPARAASPSAGAVPEALRAELVVANHILSSEGVVDGFGHVSVRHPADPSHYLLARSMAPALVGKGDIMEFDGEDAACEPTGPERSPYLERFIHGAIYRARPEVVAVVHAHSAEVVPFADTGVALRPMNHVAGFLGEGCPVFDIASAAGDGTDMLISSRVLGDALARAMGTAQVVLMRGHGFTAAAQSIRHVVFRAVYTQVDARMQAEAQGLGTPRFLSAAEARAAMATNDRLVDRPWGLWARRAEGVR